MEMLGNVFFGEGVQKRSVSGAIIAIQMVYRAESEGDIITEVQ